MRKKTKEIEDKALTPESWPSGEVRTIKMRMGRAWQLGERTLQPGETTTLDPMTAAEIVATGYADYV